MCTSTATWIRTLLSTTLHGKEGGRPLITLLKSVSSSGAKALPCAGLPGMRQVLTCVWRPMSRGKVQVSPLNYRSITLPCVWRTPEPLRRTPRLWVSRSTCPAR
ncbi:hypothetical protein GWK47_042700 [Chionoecetes opilio]|uniref:Uncharacterized protein n=1 Tax=Chionoecetes opilio TaxID=41210 RepID=A0A8J5CW96_CHIOP|nr:hypothetical protein GWK47_042700 [Chionoecetes opilio]